MTNLKIAMTIGIVAAVGLVGLVSWHNLGINAAQKAKAPLVPLFFSKT